MKQLPASKEEDHDIIRRPVAEAQKVKEKDEMAHSVSRYSRTGPYKFLSSKTEIITAYHDGYLVTVSKNRWIINQRRETDDVYREDEAEDITIYPGNTDQTQHDVLKKWITTNNNPHKTFQYTFDEIQWHSTRYLELHRQYSSRS